MKIHKSVSYIDSVNFLKHALSDTLAEVAARNFTVLDTNYSCADGFIDVVAFDIETNIYTFIDIVLTSKNDTLAKATVAKERGDIPQTTPIIATKKNTTQGDYVEVTPYGVNKNVPLVRPYLTACNIVRSYFAEKDLDSESLFLFSNIVTVA